jgi:hypothetical protein
MAWLRMLHPRLRLADAVALDSAVFNGAHRRAGDQVGSRSAPAGGLWTIHPPVGLRTSRPPRSYASRSRGQQEGQH